MTLFANFCFCLSSLEVDVFMKIRIVNQSIDGSFKDISSPISAIQLFSDF